LLLTSKKRAIEKDTEKYFQTTFLTELSTQRNVATLPQINIFTPDHVLQVI